ncbi:Sphingomyelin phosphodiesterase 4 [Gossypium arboreum]|uniref:Sphingomyelin phosphodiesterase 4 n=2 Tax=Gossypium arboreum TaxID=29729 RepID=A0A0B0PYY0_GOSAR|nr:uncharacterized protein LOC108476586 [Gossypium arboreum]KAK5777523.1 hypothetical protein PVK06_045490 [Gossypium arboreum]KHG29704.1 Sphingomyelin phosphodiesterase 4 [Gossypium arboreum]
MLPHSYAVDSLSRSQDLASAILASTTPSQISATCASIDFFLQSHSPDQSRHFFSITFPVLICKLFGFDDASSLPPPPPSQKPPSNGWVELASQSSLPDLSSKIFSLLSPNGTLMNSISAVDRHSLVKYVFPVERLPEWVRFMLSNEKYFRVISDLCPFFKGKVKEDAVQGSLCQIQLNVFEYYLFWFAYYPVCKGNSENLDSNSVKRSSKFRLENWTRSIRGFSGSSKREMEQKFEGNLYIQLLYAYLRAFVPIFDLGAHQPYRSSILNYSLKCDGSVIVRAELLVNVFVHYWLVDNDFSPLPVNVCKSFGVSFPFRSMLGEIPPTSGLGEVVKLFVKYLNLSSVMSTDGFDNIECNESPRWRVSGGFDSADLVSLSPSVCSVGSWNSWIQRPLYRFILRTFLFSPVGTSMKNTSQVFSVWVSYMEPWTISLDDFAELDVVINGSSKDVRNHETESQNSGYSPVWQAFVLSNFLYYSSLFMHFIGFAHKFLHTDPEVIAQMVLKVISLLTSSKELVDLIKNVDVVFHSKQAVSSKSALNSLYRIVPSIREQLKDWEDGLCESDADGSFLHENWNKDLKLFSDGEDGGQRLLQLFILRAEAELQGGDIAHAHSLQIIDSLKEKVSYLFGGSTMKPIPISPELRQPQHTRDELFKPRRVGNQTSANVTYKGDWMKRPISDVEVAWLAKLLIWLSSWLNESLGLDGPEDNDVGSKWFYVNIPGDAVNLNGSGEIVKTLVCLIGSWLLMMGTTTTRLMRKHGLRINLRVLASKKVVMVLLIFVVFSALKKACGLFH